MRENRPVISSVARSGRRIALAWALAACASLAAGAASGQTYPSRPVRIVVPAPPGGIADLLARAIADKLGQQWKQPVVIDNRPGAQQVVGTAAAARATPDGYTLLLLVDSALTMLPHATQKLPYDPRALTPVAMLANAPAVLVASASVPVSTLPDAIKLAKRTPNSLSIGFSTFSTQVAAVLLASQAGVQLINVPYRGTPESTQGLVAGDISLAFSVYSAVRNVPKLQILATTGVQRSAVMPEVPTFEELGFPGFETGTQMGVAVPTGTPAAIVAKLQADILSSMAQPEVQATVRSMNLDLMVKPGADWADVIRRDSEKWRKVIRGAGVSID